MVDSKNEGYSEEGESREEEELMANDIKRVLTRGANALAAAALLCCVNAYSDKLTAPARLARWRRHLPQRRSITSRTAISLPRNEGRLAARRVSATNVEHAASRRHGANKHARGGW